MIEGLTGIASLEAEMRDRLADKNREIEYLRAQLASAKEEIELANQKREFAEFEWNRATEHAQKRDAELASARKALEPFAECVQDDRTVTENMCPADYRAARAALKDLPQ